jgi:hypothetical protein
MERRASSPVHHEINQQNESTTGTNKQKTPGGDARLSTSKNMQ